MFNFDISSVIPFLSKKKERTSDNVLLPKTAQETVPYLRVYRSGIIETSPGYFTKSYKLKDINFRVASQEDQEDIFKKYKQFLSTFESDKRIQIVINNKNVDEADVVNNIVCKLERDEYNEYREELNTMLRQKMSEGKNNLVSEKYLVIGSNYPSIKDAQIGFDSIDSEVDQAFKSMSSSQDMRTEPQDIQERLQCLFNILNVGREDEYMGYIDLDETKKAGLKTRDIISPSGFRFDADNFRMGDKFARALFIKNLPTSLSTDFVAELSALPFNFTASFTIEPLAQDEAIKSVSHKLTDTRKDVMNAQKSATSAGYSPDLISPDLQFSQEQFEECLKGMRSGNQNAFHFNAVIVHYADTKEKLDIDTKAIITLGKKFFVSIDKLITQQEMGFRNALPLGRNDLKIKRFMNTDAVSLFIPFTSKELIQKGGMYYGLNGVSRNLLMINRLEMKNQNGLILGQPGSGKSFVAKREMIIVFLTTKDDIYVIDPESEYGYMAKLMGGSVIKLQAGSNIYINPFDMDIQYADDEESTGNDPVKLKTDHICTLCETALGGHYEITSIQRSIIDRVVIELYKPYMNHMRNLNDSSITCDVTASPTMDMFYELLMRQPEPEAQNIALALEIYCRGSFDTFAHRTNVDINNRFTVFDIKNIGTGMKEMGVQVCLNHIWNKIIDNQSYKKRTWFYIDEFYLLTKTRSSAAFLQEIWKRARKWGGVPTAITQNVSDLLTSDEAASIISNCEFIIMLSQAPMDRAVLADMYSISEAQLSYITNSPSGQGLIYNGEGIIPFVDKFPKDTKLYKIMSSKMNERIVA